MSITLGKIESQYDSTTLNDNFDKIEEYINSKLTHRNKDDNRNNQFLSDVDMNGYKLLNVDYTGDNPAIEELIRKIALCLSLGSYNAKNLKIKNLANPTSDYDASTKKYVDDAIASANIDVDSIKAQIEAGDSALLNKLNQEILDRIAGDNANANLIANLRQLVDSNFVSLTSQSQSLYNDAVKKVADEKKRAEDAEKELSKAIDVEKQERQSAVLQVSNALHLEVNRALDAEASLQGQINTISSKITTVESAVNSINTSITNVKTDVEKLKVDVYQAQTDITSIKSDVTKVKDDMETLKTKMSDQQTAFSALQVSVTQKLSDFDLKLVTLETKVNTFDARIKALEATNIGNTKGIKDVVVVLTDADLYNLPIGTECIADLSGYNNSPFEQEDGTATADLVYVSRGASPYTASPALDDLDVTLKPLYTSGDFNGRGKEGVISWFAVGGAGVEEAPKDSKHYLRKDESWVAYEDLNSPKANGTSLKLDVPTVKGLKVGDKFLVSTEGSESYPEIKIVSGTDMSGETVKFVYTVLKTTGDTRSVIVSVKDFTFEDFSGEGYVSRNTRVSLEFSFPSGSIQPYVAELSVGENNTEEDIYYSISFNFEGQEGTNQFLVKSITTKYNDKTDYTTTSLPVLGSLDQNWYMSNSSVYGNYIFQGALVEGYLQMKELAVRYNPSSNATSLDENSRRSDFTPVMFQPMGLFYNGHYMEYVHPLYPEYKVVINTGKLSDVKVAPNAGVTVKMVKVSDGTTLDLKDIFLDLKNNGTGAGVREKIIMYPQLTVSGKTSNPQAYLNTFELDEVTE